MIQPRRMVQLTDPTALDAKAEEVRGALGQGSRVQVMAVPGTGRRALLRCLEEKLGEEAVSVAMPPLDDVDASLHGLLQAASALGKGAVEGATEDKCTLRDRALKVGQDLAASHRCLLVWIPSSWDPGENAPTPDAELRHSRAEELLSGWFAASSLRIVLIMSAGSEKLVERASQGISAWRSMRLDSPRVTASALEPAEAWGAYAGAADALRKALEKRPHLTCTPLQTRLLVGLVGLGEQPAGLLDWLVPRRHSSFALERLLCETLDAPKHRTLKKSLQRFLRARLPLPREVVARITQVPKEHAPLLTECITAGGAEVQVTESVRRASVKEFRRPLPDPATHLALADYHEKLDGAASPAGAFRHITHWLEKTHQLGRSGPEGAERWRALDLPSRELYWDRARSLSAEHRRYLEAAELFRECLERFDERDAYSWHYRGYNLDCAGAQRKAAEHAFREAVRLRPTHPWYNGRLVTFLIDQARFRDADQEWQQVLTRIDPDGEAAFRAPWLLREIHRWVVKAWLRSGEVRRAQEVFDDIPDLGLDEAPWIRELRQDLEDAEEAERLGESVYPAETPIAERWRRPEALVSEQDQLGHPLLSWYPGRIVAVDEEGVHAALATHAEDPKQQRLIARTLSADEWARYGFCPAAEAEGRFILLAVYGPEGEGESVKIIPVQHHAAPVDERELQRELRYLERTPA